MPPKSQSTLQRKTKTKPTVVKLGTTSLSKTGSSRKRFNPLTAVSSSERSSSPSEPLPKNHKGKEKAIEVSSDEEIPALGDRNDDRLWVDIYEPCTEAELAVHVRKVDDVRRWFSEAFEGGPSGKLRRYRKILALTGPSGVGKTATVQVLAREMGFKILEWRNAIGDSSSFARNVDTPYEFNEHYESTFAKFEAFLNRATSCHTIFSEASLTTPTLSLSSTSTHRVSDTLPATSKHIVLLEDLPNILHAGTQAQFHTAIRSFIEATSQSASPVPIVVIMSDATMRGETRDELLTSGGGVGGYAWSREKSDVLDIRTVLPRDLLTGPYVTRIGFNPVAPTLMKKALTGLINQHFKSKSSFSKSPSIPPSKDLVDMVVESANGDIRSAIMLLQFSCIPGKKSRGKKRSSGSSGLAEAITQRESSLALFHLIGRVMYNKRKGDPSSASATAKDIKKEKELDAALKDPPKLPQHLHEHERRASRVDVDSLYADSPIDSSLFSLYIHQNYTQFCNELEECDGVIDWLSWVDSSGGDMWYQANPHRFHLLTLGTLHSLPSPVPRRSQKIFKPDYFDNLSKEKDAWDAVNDIRYWMMVYQGLGSAESLTTETSRWSKPEVALELGAVLKLKQAQRGGGSGMDTPPSSHSLFSKLVFTSGDGQRGQQVGEDVTVEDEDRLPIEDELGVGMGKRGEDDCATGDWLDDDDIEEF